VKDVIYHPAARKILGRMPSNTAMRIRDKILAFAADLASQANNVKTMADGSHVRLRVGDWRVIMLDGEVIDVLKIGPRGTIYD
jgi:mRNA interferase RelE/StbE